MRELREFVTPDSPSLETFSDIQLCTINEPLLPNLKALELAGIEEWFIPLIPMFLSPRTTTIFLSFGSEPNPPMVASMITTIPALCPDLQAISLYPLPRDPIITAAISGMLLVANQSTLRELRVDSPLTEEASEVLYELPNLCGLEVVIERETPLPSASLPNLTRLIITCNNEDNWPQVFHGATFGKLESIMFFLQSEQIGDFLGAFERVALSSSVQNTLSTFYLSTLYSWNPKYSSLLPFTQLVCLVIQFSCDGGCSSTVDDDTVISLSRAMPKLESLELGNTPCGQITGGITTKGLLALARQCPNLYTLCAHLRVASLSEPPVVPGMVRNAGPVASWTGCALTQLEVGEAPVPEGSAIIIALTLLRIFPQLNYITSNVKRWGEVRDAISHFREIIGSSKQCFPTTPRSALNGCSTGAALETSS